MNLVFRLVADYLRRTLGVWVLAWFLHTMQAATLFAGRSDRVPLIGTMIAAIAFFATFESRQAVMQTLPLSRRQIALTRWWLSIGWPALFSAFCIVGGWLANGGWGFPRPEAADLWFHILVCASVLVMLSALPMPTLSDRRQGMARFALVWGVLAIASLRGLSASLLPMPAWFVLVAFALGLVGVSYARAEQRGDVFAFPRRLLDRLRRRPARTSAAEAGVSRLRGWSVLVAQVARTTAILTIAGIVGITLLRYWLPALGRTEDRITVLGVVYISVIGVASSIFVRRWLNAIRVLQILPIRDSSLALITWTLLMAPSLIACLAASAVNAVVPAWGQHIPYFMYPVFAIVPIFFVPSPYEVNATVPSAIRQWSPLMQIALWPLWAGAFSSMALTKLIPAWFNTLAIAGTFLLALVGYLLVFSRIRSGAGLERTAGPLATR